MVLNLVSLASRLQEPFHTGAVVILLGATAGAGTTTNGLAGGGGVGAGVVDLGGGGVGHGAVTHGIRGIQAVLCKEYHQSLPDYIPKHVNDLKTENFKLQDCYIR